MRQMKGYLIVWISDTRCQMKGWLMLQQLCVQAPHSECREEELDAEAVHGSVCEHGAV